MHNTEIPALIGRALAEGRTLLSEVEARSVIAGLGIPTPRERCVFTLEAAKTAAAELGYPVVMKIVSPDISHKSDVGGVVTGCYSDTAAAEAFVTLQAVATRLGARWEGCLIQEMIKSPLELMVGAARDDFFGTVTLCGAGGVLVEHLRDTCFRVGRIDVDEARRMLGRLRLSPLLAGYRNLPAVDVDTLAQAISAVSGLLDQEPAIAGIDLNPLLVRGDGRVVAVDARIVLHDSAATAAASPDGTVPAVTTREGEAPGGMLAGPYAHLEAAFRPRAVAVAGASANPAKLGSRVVRHLLRHQFAGKLYLLHPEAKELYGLPCHRTLADIPEPLDLVDIAVPPAAVPEVLAGCAGVGVKTALVHSASLSPAGTPAAEQEQVRLARHAGLRIIGPNTVGLVRPAGGVTFSSSPFLAGQRLRAGHVALITHAGGIGTYLASRAVLSGPGIAYWANVGDEADLTMNDCLEYFLEQDDVQAVALFIEALSEWPRFTRAARRARELRKPILYNKAGRSEIGSTAVASHSQRLAGRYPVYQGAMEQHGAVEVDDVADLLDFAAAFAGRPLPAGPNMAVVTSSGGACSIMADECIAAGLRVPELSAQTRADLERALPAGAVTRNPVDVTAQILVDLDLYARVNKRLLADPDVHGIMHVISLSDPDCTGLAEALAQGTAQATKPVLVALTLERSLVAQALDVMVTSGIPVFASFRQTVRAMAAMVQYARFLKETGP